MANGIFPETFWPLALAHALALASPGPDFMLVVSHGMRNRFFGSVFICVGIALGNGIYIALAIAGWTGIAEYPFLYRTLEVGGAAYLAWLGARLLKAARQPPPHPETSAEPKGVMRQLLLGLGSALLNPKNMVFYLTLMTVLVNNNALFRQRVAAGIWMVGLVLVWDLALARIVSGKRAQTALWQRIPIVERVFGVFLFGLAAWLTLNGMSR